MARKGNDYDAARILHAKGLTLKQIHEETGIPYERLAKYAQRHEWTTERTKAVQIVSQNVQAELIERSTGHLLKISGMADKAIDVLLAKSMETLELDELQTLAHVADTFDKIARRTYGLDAQACQGRANVQVNIGVSRHAGNAPSSAFDDVIEVQSERISDASEHLDRADGDASK